MKYICPVMKKAKSIVVSLIATIALVLILVGATAWLIFGAGWARMPMYLGMFISCTLGVTMNFINRKKKKQ